MEAVLKTIGTKNALVLLNSFKNELHFILYCKGRSVSASISNFKIEMLKSVEDNILEGNKFYMDYYPYTLNEYFRLHRVSWLGKLVVMRKVAEGLHWL